MKKMKKMKVMTIVGTRPEIVRLSRVIPKLDDYCDHVLVHTGQNYDYELNEIFFNDLEIRAPDYSLNVAGKTAAETIGKIIIAVDVNNIPRLGSIIDKYFKSKKLTEPCRGYNPPKLNILL